MAVPRKRSRKEVRAIGKKLGQRFLKVKIKLTKVQSSNVRAVGYDPTTKQLAVSFHSNPKPYRYPDVPKYHHTRLLKAKSKGQYFNKHIKPNFSFIRPT